MLKEHEINIGDNVTVYFRAGGGYDILDGKVTVRPQATGDCWKLVQDGGAVVYVQQFETMTKEEANAS